MQYNLSKINEQKIQLKAGHDYLEVFYSFLKDSMALLYSRCQSPKYENGF